MSRMRYLALALLPTMSFGAVHGSPEVGYPGPTPTLSVDVGNDNFVPCQPDDRITASWGLQYHDGDLALGAEYDMLTCQGAGTRQDELTLTAGYVLWDDQDVRFVVSGGARAFRPMDGQNGQNAVHKRTGDRHMELTYDESYLTPICIFDATHQDPMTCGDYNVGFFWRAQMALHARGNELECWGGPYYDCGDKSFLWVGAGYRQYQGEFYGHTQEVVEKVYNGWSFRGGVRLQALTASLVIGTHASYGTIGLCF